MDDITPAPPKRKVTSGTWVKSVHAPGYRPARGGLAKGAGTGGPARNPGHGKKAKARAARVAEAAAAAEE